MTRDDDHDLLSKPASRWSTTECFIAAAIAFLVLRGLIRPDDPKRRQKAREMLRDPSRLHLGDSWGFDPHRN